MRSRDVTRWLALLAIATGCSANTTGGEARPVVSASASTPDPVSARVAALISLAREIEPTLTPLLVELAEREGGEMVKLAHRLKTEASTERKLRTELAQRPKLGVGDVRIEDALRYTMRVDDDPPGHYLAAARITLAALEERGQHVEYVKNYWPTDDNYSGINSVLRDPSGLFWELQFHTSASFAALADTRDQYEEFRRVDTERVRRRQLFDAMTERWEDVPVPQGVLVEGALHERAQLRERKRP